MKKVDVVHEICVVVACGDRRKRIEFNGGVAFREKGDDCLEAAVFKMMNGIARVAERTEGVSADEADPGKTDGDKETEIGLSA